MFSCWGSLVGERRQRRLYGGYDGAMEGVLARSSCTWPQKVASKLEARRGLKQSDWTLTCLSKGEIILF